MFKRICPIVIFPGAAKAEFKHYAGRIKLLGGVAMTRAEAAWLVIFSMAVGAGITRLLA